MIARKPTHVKKSDWDRLTDDDREIFDEMPKHAQDIMLLRRSQHYEYFSNLTTLMYLFLALIFFIGAWSAGYPPWWFIANMLRTIGLLS